MRWPPSRYTIQRPMSLTRPDVMRGPRFTSTGPVQEPPLLTSSDFRCGPTTLRGQADAVQFRRSRAPVWGGVARGANEAAVVVGEEAAQDAVGGVEIASLGEAQFALQAVLQDAPEAFDAAFSLGIGRR